VQTTLTSEQVAELKTSLANAENENKKYYELKNRVENGEKSINASKELAGSIQNSIENIDKQIEALQRRREDEQRKRDDVMSTIENNANLLADLRNELDSTPQVDTSNILQQLEQYNTELSANSKVYAEKELYEKQVKQRNEFEVERRELDEKHQAVEMLQNALIEDLNIPYKLKVIEGVMNVQE
jgi:peptidoglycan hydrolase CwlO-like protein